MDLFNVELDQRPSVNEANRCTCCSQVNIVNQQSGFTGPYLDITAEGQQVRVHLPSFPLSLLNPSLPLSHTQMGEFFGYSIAAADLNGDG